MNNKLFAIACMLLLYACSNKLGKLEKAGMQNTTIEQVKHILAKEDEIPADSIRCVKLEDGLYITQGFGRVDNMIRLVKLYPQQMIVLDSILTYQQIDLVRQEKIRYDTKNNWFIYSDISSGSNDFSQTMNLVRVKRKHFVRLFAYSKDAGIFDGESIPPVSESVQVQELELNKKRIVLVTSCQIDSVNSESSHPIYIDTVTFEFSKSRNTFLKKKSTNPMMQEKWWPDKGEYRFKI